jgi:hypothetical protein
MDYSKIDWSKLPELPRVSGLPVSVCWDDNDPYVVRATITGIVSPTEIARRSNGVLWSFHGGFRKQIEETFAVSDIIDRFISEQEAELSKPKPRRVTPDELLVELIQKGGKPVRVHFHETPEWLCHQVRWAIDGLGVAWGESDHWSKLDISYFYNFTHFDILDTPEPPKPRLPVKTKAPKGCWWEIWYPAYNSDGEARLVWDAESGSRHMPLPGSRESALQLRAIADAYLELNP